MPKDVLVVGGGIAGIQASLDLADMGHQVHLVERRPSIGGRMAQLDKTFPTNDCSICILSPKLIDVGRHPRINILSYSEVLEVSGEPPDLEVKVRRFARYVKETECTACGDCVAKCPVKKIPDAFNMGLGMRKAIYQYFQQGIPATMVIDSQYCIKLAKGKKCAICAKFCKKNAIDFEAKDEDVTLQVGAVLLCPGFEEFDPRWKKEYGYGRFKNVLTSIEFERCLSSSGPHRGHVIRPSDGEEPHRLAFIQCVGSRDTRSGNDYCSSVCCMYATKEAVIACEHIKGLSSTLFYMDMRCFGKDFDKFVDRARDEYGVRFVQTRVSSIEEDPSSSNLLIKYETEEGEVKQEEFDLVVLSVGLAIPQQIQTLAKRIGVELNENNFCRTDPLTPIQTSRPGVYVCGVFQGPKDIPETVVQASGAAASASALLSGVESPPPKLKEVPPEVNIDNLPPRIGAFICHCGINIGGVVDVPAVVEYARTLPFVAYAEENLYSCSQDTQELIKEKIKKYNLNRLFVAACSPRTHEYLFQETLREAGLNPYLFTMANIRNLCSWVHMDKPEQATEKAKDLVRMGIAKCARTRSLHCLSLPVTKRGLVVGGGVTGMVASLSLSDQGYEVYLIEREGELGGNLRHIHYTLEREGIQEYLKDLIERVKESEKIKLCLNATIKAVDGYVGNYKTTISSAQGEIVYEHGVAIIATGGNEYKPEEYLYGESPKVITQRELEERIVKGELGEVGSVVMIQCVGSREPQRPYCSRYCCSAAVKNALKLKEINPRVDIYILYRDIRTYGFKEDYYRRAREQGVVFLRYSEDDKPCVSSVNGRVKVLVRDRVLKERLEFSPDLLVLSTAIVPQRDNDELAKMFKLPLNAEKFFLEAHVKLRPVEFATDGVFLAGLCHAPKGVSESIDQAAAAAAKAATILSKDHIESESQVCQVDETRCTACGSCVPVCAFNALEIAVVDERSGKRAAKLNEALCKGCGACAATCRCGALDIRGYTNEQIFEMIESF